MAKDDFMIKEIGNYKITGRLGRGGMGDVYKGVQKSLDRTVAIKVLSPNMGRSEEFAQRFEVEAKAISMLQHHNIVSIYEYGEENGLKYFAMECIDGDDLAKQIKAKKKLPIEEVINYSKQICRGLKYAHAKNVLHRDIKPQNILVNKEGICKISDFGIAKIFQKSDITMTGMAVGTPEYMSPEQAEGNELDAQTDIYSIGVVMYEMLTGRPPFTGTTPVSIAYKQVHELPVPPSAYRKDTPKRLELIILKALKKNKMVRYKTIEGMLNDLDTVDLNEFTDRATISVSHQKRESVKKDTTSVSNRRITDRRSGQRRNVSSGKEVPKPAFTKAYFEYLIETQGVSLFLIVLLYILFLLHIIDVF